MTYPLTPQNLRVSQGSIDGETVALVEFIIWQERIPYRTAELSFSLDQVQGMSKDEFIQQYGDHFQALPLVR